MTAPSRRDVTRATLAIVVLFVGCRRAAAPPPDTDAPPEPASTPAVAAADDREPLAPGARTHYREAQRLVVAGALDEAQAGFEQAVAVEPDFTEGWYNLGATYGNQAVREAGRGADASALEFFRKGVAAKTRSRELMTAGKWFLYDARERAIVLHDVEKALEDADAVLADEASLLIGLRLRARGVRHPEE